MFRNANRHGCQGTARSSVVGGMFLVLSLLLYAAGPALASDAPSKDDHFATWKRTADRAQAALRTDRASTSYLERLRDQLAEERSAALKISETTDVTVRALQAQLDALGPAPEEGAQEPETLSNQRSQLLIDIGEASAPLLEANGAFQRADVLIKEMDRRIRDRHAADLLTRYPSAVFIHHWPETITELGQWAGSLVADTYRGFLDPNKGATLSDGLPIAIVMSVFGLLFLFYALPISVRRVEALRAAAPEGSRPFLPDLANAVVRLVVPALAAGCFFLAWRSIDPDVYALRFLDGAVTEVVVDLILAYWLAHLVFSPIYPPHRIFSVDDKAARLGCQTAIGIGIVSACEVLLDRLDRHGQLSPDALAVVATPFMIMGGALFWTLAAVLKPQTDGAAVEDSEAMESEDAAGDTSVGAQFLAFVRLALKVLSVVIPVAAIVGYVRLSRDTFDATVQTIALLTLALVLFHAVLNVAALSVGRTHFDPKDRKSLLPILTATFLGLALLPILALVWGARPSDIADIWRLMSDGVRLGDARISIDGFLTLVLVFSIGLVATRWLQAALRTTVLPRTRFDIGMRNAISTGVGYVGITLAAVVAISSAGVDLSHLAIVAGALSVGIGFGLQTIVSNFVSGIILLIERPVKHGDWIEASGFSGYVRKISVRSTRIETFDRHDVIIPNADLITGTVKNMTLTSASGRVIVPVSVAYGSDLEKVRAILLDAAQNHSQTLRFPTPYVLFMEMGDNALLLEVRCFVRDINSMLTVRSDLMFEIYGALREAGIEIPFPQRDIHIRSLPPQRTDGDVPPPRGTALDDIAATDGQT